MDENYTILNNIHTKYFDSKILNEGLKDFNDQLRDFHINTPTAESIINLNFQVFDYFSRIEVSTLFVSITGSDSIFYRFSGRQKNVEFKLEEFIDYTGEPEDVEAVLHIYTNGVKEGSYYGSLDEMFCLIMKKETPLEAISEGYEYIYKGSAAKIREYIPQYVLSFTSNPEEEFPKN